MMLRIAVLITCHNRKQTTLACLDALFRSDLPSGIAINVVLVDDGSTDGTAVAVKQLHPSVVIEHGDGSLFWSRGMHRAQELAMRSAPDFVVWLNDDTVIRKDTLVRMLSTFDERSLQIRHPVIVVGATVDAATNQLTYAGLQSVSGIRRFQYRRVWHPDRVQECHAMNGNVVLIPRIIVERIGNLDPFFEHAMGDIDYALRAREAGFRVFVAAGVMGYCSSNPLVGSLGSRSLSVGDRWRKFTSRKELPPRSWLHFVRRHAGLLWPAYFLYPYIKFALRVVARKLGIVVQTLTK